MSDYVSGGNVTKPAKTPTGVRVSVGGNGYIMPYLSMVLMVPLLAALCFMSFGVMVPALNKQAAWARTQSNGYEAVKLVQAATAKDVPVAQIINHQARYLKGLAATVTMRAGSCVATNVGAYTTISRGADNYFYVYTSGNGTFHWVQAATIAAAITKACAA